jgi:hypothetical protein
MQKEKRLAIVLLNTTSSIQDILAIVKVLVGDRLAIENAE